MLQRSHGRLAARLLLVLGLTTSMARADETLSGFWKDSDGEVILHVAPCGDAVCGRVAWLRLPFGPDSKPLLDYRNPDASLRSRPVCGLEVISGFKKQDDGTFADGKVYVSDLGMTFSGTATKLNDNQIEVRGYVGLSIFGQSEVWTRVGGQPPPCQTASAPQTAKPQ